MARYTSYYFAPFLLFTLLLTTLRLLLAFPPPFFIGFTWSTSLGSPTLSPIFLLA